jgi:5'-deoxynucleotidase
VRQSVSWRAVSRPRHEVLLARDAELLAWVKAADKLDAYSKWAMELAVGNREFAMAKRQLGETLRGLDMPEVGY